ncbi:MAG: RNA helicase, partial [Alphaproteobacteria bacterium]|nr:RNA helicase [Alphaproteobacteria bacterium]
AAAAAAEVAEPAPTPAARAAPSETRPTPATSDRPVQETHLRQSDRRGDSAAQESQRSNGRPFGEGDIPAFLRRPVSLKG